MNQVVLRRRSSDKPWQWAVLFSIASILVVPFYCITRRTWRPILFIFAGISSASLLWAIIVGLIQGFTGTNYQYHPISESLLPFVYLFAVYGCGYSSVKHLRDKALRISRIDNASIPGESLKGYAMSHEPSKGKQESINYQLRSKKIDKVFACVVTVIVLLTAGYGIHTASVESTIKSNPVLAAAAKSGTIIKVKHFNCGDLYGYYDAAIDTMQICAAVHDDQLFSSKEATIRHEAWHLVQACSAVKTKDDEWGEFHLVDSPLLAEKSLTPDELQYISDVYEVQDHAIEKEAFLAETHLTDGQIIQAIEEKCYFPD